MTQRNLLELARRGDIEAISTLLNRILQTQGVAAKVGSKEDCLYISLVGDPAPSEEKFATFIYQAILRLGVEPIRFIRVYGQQAGQPSPTWYREMELEKPETATEQPIDARRASPQTPGQTSHQTPIVPPPDLPEQMHAGEASVQAEGEESQQFQVVGHHNLRANLQGEIRGSTVAVGTATQPNVYYVLQPDARLGDRVDRAPLANRPQARLRLLPILLLPAPLPNLLDRLPELEAASSAFQAHQPLEFYGQNGIGKTALLRHLAHHPQTMPSFPAGIVYLSADRQRGSDLLQLLFDAFHDTDLPLKPTEIEIRQALQGKQTLVLLDDNNLSREEVDELSQQLPDMTFVLASAEQQLWNRGTALHLEGLPLEESVLLIERELGRSLTPQERTIAQTLHETLQGHPLRLLLVTALVRERRASLEEIVQRIQPALAEQSLIRQILAPLLKPQRTLLALLAAFAGIPLSAEQIGTITSIPDAESMLQVLQRQHLVQSIGSRYFVNRSLAQTLESELDVVPWMQRALAYFIPWVEQNRMLPRTVLEESDALLHAMAWAISNERWEDVLHLGKILAGALTLGKWWGAWEQVLQWQLQAARSIADPTAESWALHQLGTRALCLDDSTTARNYLIQALQLRQSQGDQSGAAVTHHNLSLIPSTPAPAPVGAQPDPNYNALPPVPVAQPPSKLALWLTVAGLFLLSGLVGLLIGNLLRQKNPTPTPTTDATSSPTPNPTDAPPLSASGLNFSTNNLNFGRRVAGSPGVTQNFTLTNKGTTPVTFNQVTLAGRNPDAFAIVRNSCAGGTELTPNETCTIQIRFTPQQANFYQSELVIDNTATNQPIRIPLQGAGTQQTEPSLGVSTTILRFGNRPANTSSPSARITLTSNGAAPLRVDSIELRGSQNNFTLQSETCPEILRPGQQCNAFVQFTPKATGNFRADLMIFHNAVGNPQRIALSGSANAPAAASLSLEPRTLDFGEIEIGQTTRAQTITVTNTGNAPLRINNLNVQGNGQNEFSIDSNCWNAPISPRNRCNVSITFTPRSSGERRGRLVITSNAAEAPSARLRGVGAASRDANPPTFTNISAEPNPVFYDAGDARLTFRAVVTDPSGIASVRVRYRFRNSNNAGPFRVLDMQPEGANRHVLEVNLSQDTDAYTPINGTSGVIEYEIEATDREGNSGNSPSQTIEARPVVR